MRVYFPFEDINIDGKLDEPEWKSFQAVMAAENGLLALHAGGTGDVTAKALRWKYQRHIPQLPSTLLYRGVMYMINDGGILTTIDPASGKPFKEGRLRGAVDKYYASPVAADGKVFFVGNSGVVTILKAGPDQEILSVNELDDECFATPAIADGRVYIRTRGMLYCFGLS
jgi:outer membrane protein assembly factor BamB